jgi:hypothetical protein
VQPEARSLIVPAEDEAPEARDLVRIAHSHLEEAQFTGHGPEIMEWAAAGRLAGALAVAGAWNSQPVAETQMSFLTELREGPRE